MWLVAVFGTNLTTLNDQFSGKSVGVFPMDQDVGGQLAEDGVAKANALHSIQKKRVRQMLLHKSDYALVALNQIGPNKIPIIVSIQVYLT